MDIVKSFRRNVVENKSLIFISIGISFLIRLCFLYNSDGIADTFFISGYLWTEKINRFFIENRILSFTASFLFTISITLYSFFITSKHKLIKSRPFLLYLFSLISFSLHPAFIHMSPQYISLLFILICTDTLFSSYQKNNAAGSAYIIGFMLSIGSLFAFSTLIFSPLFLIGFKYMRSLRIKTFISFILGITTIYWLSLFYFLWKDTFSEFLYPFDQLYPIIDKTILQTSIDKVIIIITFALSLIVLITNYAISSYQDKIQARANISYIFATAIFSGIVCLFVIYDPILALYSLLFSSSILLSHFFSLTEKKWKVYFFYFFISLYLFLFVFFLTN